MKCKNCGNEIDKNAVVCVSCGSKIKKPIFKKWWFWVVIIIVVIAVASGSGNDNDSDKNLDSSSQGSSASTQEYTPIDLQTMIDELKSNALKAENTYQNKYIEITGKISNIDSDGSYISIEPVGADEWNFDAVQCYITSEDQKQFIIEKSTGDTVTIKGKVKSVGEVLGYSLNIDSIS